MPEAPNAAPMKRKADKPRTIHPPRCPYCSATSVLVADTVIYGRDFGGLRFWLCSPCDAYVGTHRNSGIPLGRLANKELRTAKMQAHSLFDPLWKAAMAARGWSKTKARREAYSWLSRELGVPFKRCHIGMFDLEQTMRVVDLCKAARAQRRAA